MLDKDLALLYGVPTKRLNEAVKRNIGRFPLDFMFQLDKKEAGLFSRSQIVTLKPGNTDRGNGNPSLRSQIATLETGRGKYAKYLPMVFTEQGIAMLSSVLNSDKAIQINIQIIRIFIKLREMIDAYQDLREKVEEMEQNNETNFREIFRVIKLLIVKENRPKREIGF
ncbi:MAG: hypothetical protein RL641_903 [Candidatus Parcubacteria bacterium]